jgi:hypothetical protein
MRKWVLAAMIALVIVSLAVLLDFALVYTERHPSNVSIMSLIVGIFVMFVGWVALVDNIESDRADQKEQFEQRSVHDERCFKALNYHLDAVITHRNELAEELKWYEMLDENLYVAVSDLSEAVNLAYESTGSNAELKVIRWKVLEGITSIIRTLQDLPVQIQPLGPNVLTDFVQDKLAKGGFKLDGEPENQWEVDFLRLE